MDLFERSDPYPDVKFVTLPELTLHETENPTTATARGTITDPIAPMTPGDLTINGVPATLTPHPENVEPYGPFKQSFEGTVTINGYDLLIRADGRNALGNLGTDKIVAEATVFSDVDGEFERRTFTAMSQTPSTVNTGVYPFRLEVRALRVESGMTTITAKLYTDPATFTTIPLARASVGSEIFKSEQLYLVPEDTDLTGETPEIIETRIKVPLGTTLRTTITSSDGALLCEDRGIVTGSMFVNAETMDPISVVRAGLPRDAIHHTNNKNLLAVMGAPGDFPNLSRENDIPYIPADLLSLSHNNDLTYLPLGSV